MLGVQAAVYTSIFVKAFSGPQGMCSAPSEAGLP
jgi:hypothetical protein